MSRLAGDKGRQAEREERCRERQGPPAQWCSAWVLQKSFKQRDLRDASAQGRMTDLRLRVA